MQPNLLKHEEGFPDAETLLKLVKKGLPEYGMLGVGDGKDSEGSDWIIKVLEEKDERPLWISVWGGSNTLAQALYKIKHTKTEGHGPLGVEYPDVAWGVEGDTPSWLSLILNGLNAPVVEKKETAHIILKVTDKGKPSLSRYKRIIVTIIPK